MNHFYALLFFFLITVNPFQAMAQQANPFQLPGDITVDQSTTILQKAEQLAESEKILVNIAIVDAGANLKAFLRMDGSYLGSIDVAIKKAKTASMTCWRFFLCRYSDCAGLGGFFPANLALRNALRVTFC